MDINEASDTLQHIVSSTITEWGNGKSDIGDALGGVRMIELAAEQFRRELIAVARNNGHTWAEIGDALGTTRQNAQQRYGYRVGTPQRPIIQANADQFTE